MENILISKADDILKPFRQPWNAKRLLRAGYTYLCDIFRDNLRRYCQLFLKPPLDKRVLFFRSLWSLVFKSVSPVHHEVGSHSAGDAADHVSSRGCPFMVSRALY